MNENVHIVNNFITEKDADFFINYIDKNCDNELLFRKRIGVAHKKGLAFRAVFPDEKPPTRFKNIEKEITKYANLFINEIEKISLNKNYFYGVSITRLSKDIQLRIHKDVHNTITSLSYSGVLYLNDNYLGGEIAFLDKFKPESIFPLYEKEMGGFCYKPKFGDLVIFPSDKWHGGTRVEDGYRYSIIFWSTENENYKFKGFDSEIVWDEVEKDLINANSK